MVRPYECEKHDHVNITYDSMWYGSCPLCAEDEKEIDPDDCECDRVDKLGDEISELKTDIEKHTDRIDEFKSTINALEEVILDASELTDGNELPDDIAEKQIAAIDKLVEQIAKAKTI